SSASGKCSRNAGTTFATPCVLSSGVPISTISTPPSSAAAATVRPCAIVETSTEIWKLYCVRSRSASRALAACAASRLCAAGRGRMSARSAAAPAARPPSAARPPCTRNDRRPTRSQTADRPLDALPRAMITSLLDESCSLPRPTLEMDYTVVVAGGGPAGAVTALRLARAGTRVLVVDREQPRRVEAAEIMSPEGRTILENEDL